VSTSVVANRIYARGRVAAEDFQEMGPGDILLRVLKPPKETTSGLIVGQDVDLHPVRACVAFEVARLCAPELMPQGNPLNLKVGDVVLARNALVDPLFGNELGLTNMYAGVVAVLERAP
jgi:hypothetical protein